MMPLIYRAYLDIETTSLSSSNGKITMIGICLEDGKNHYVKQLVGNQISSLQLIKILEQVHTLYTYNGQRFDLPFIKSKLGVDLTKHIPIHRDLMFDCWKKGLKKGGLKGAEKKLGIRRKLCGIDGRVAVTLWDKYELSGDKNALNTLLEYNKEDVLNLIELRKKLKSSINSREYQTSDQDHRIIILATKWSNNYWKKEERARYELAYFDQNVLGKLRQLKYPLPALGVYLDKFKKEPFQYMEVAKIETDDTNIYFYTQPLSTETIESSVIPMKNCLVNICNVHQLINSLGNGSPVKPPIEWMNLIK